MPKQDWVPRTRDKEASASAARADGRSRDGHRSKANSHSTGRLCEQVARSIDLSLGDARDGRLNDLTVREVRPAPSSSRLRVVLAPLDDGLDPEVVCAAIQAASPWLRGRVAEDIHRRRVPTLLFEYLPVR